MNRVIKLILVGLLVIGLVACEQSNNNVSNNDSIKTISMADYEAYICLSNASEEKIISSMREYAEISPVNPKGFNFSYASIDSSKDEYLIKCPKDIRFFDFHNMVGWFNDFNSCGIMLNKKDSKESYYCYEDKGNSWGDTLIGFLNNKQEITISLLEVTWKTGDLLLGKTNPKAESVKAYLKNNFFDMDVIASFDQMSSKSITLDIGE